MNAPDKFIADAAADPRHDPTRVIRAPRGSQLTCKSWLTEAPLPHDAEQPRPRGGRAPAGPGGLRRHRPRGAQLGLLRPDPRLAARSWTTTRRLLIQSGKPVGVFKTHANAPRVLIANSNLVPKWANWEHFNELDRKGLFMYGQMTAGSWIYIGSQGIVQGTFETFVEAGRQHYGDDLAGKLDPHRRPGRHGRRAAAGRHPGRRGLAQHRVPAVAASTSACAPATWTSRRATSTTRSSSIKQHTAAQGSGVDRAAGQRRRRAAGTGQARQGRRHQARPGHRPDLGARPDQRLPAARLERGAMAGRAEGPVAARRA